MVFSSITFLFLFLPAVFFFYWLPDVCSKIKQLLCKKPHDNQDQNLAVVQPTTNANSSYILENKEENNSNQRPLSSFATQNSLPLTAHALGEDLTLPFRKYKNLVLLAFSILFYAWGEPAFVLVMILSIIANYSFGRLIDKYRNKDKLLLWISVAFNLGILFIFKYLCFTLQNIGWLINKDFSSIKIALPIGISFFTFQAMSYVIDVYRKKVEVQKSLFNLGLYISLFPQLIAGLIISVQRLQQYAI